MSVYDEIRSAPVDGDAIAEYIGNLFADVDRYIGRLFAEHDQDAALAALRAAGLHQTAALIDQSA